MKTLARPPRAPGPCAAAAILTWLFAIGCGEGDPGLGPATAETPVAPTPETTEVELAVRALTLGALAERVTGRIVCSVPDGPGRIDLGLGEVPVEIDGIGAGRTDGAGGFRIERPYFGGTVRGRVSYQGAVGSGLTVTTLKVMDDVHAPRSDGFEVAGTVVPAPLTKRAAGATLDLGAIRLVAGDCEVWRGGREVIRDFHEARGAGMPGGRLAFMRRTGVWGTTPYAFYDYVDLATNYLSAYGGLFQREMMFFHESAHVVRDIADGDAAHWHWDNTRIRYARNHSGLEISEDAYAFHEGWADYWASKRRNRGTARPTGGFSTDHTDWVENLVANRLLSLSSCVGDAAMVATLEGAPGAIHSLHQFETRLCSGRSCCGLTRAAPPACPPEYFNDGLTCRRDNIRAKASYGRGVGTPPTGCGAGRQYDAGLCYPSCASGYGGVGPVCWQRCPSGYHDDGAFCRRDAHIFGSNNDACPWYDKCGLTFARGCSTCPAGYQNDGCTCRRNAHIFAKSSYGRGVGGVPHDCGGGRQLDAGLCYPFCAGGYHGVGPVCWGSCPAGWADHGATCYRDPHIISRFP